MKEKVTVRGMSGWLIIDEAGNAIGVICSGGTNDGGSLMHSLPRWFPTTANDAPNMSQSS